MSAALFISDVHLSVQDPATARAFGAFLERVPQLARRLYILGDLFEYWIGDDARFDAFNTRIAAELRAVSDAGVDLYFMAGNRDFLIDTDFALDSGLQLLSDPTVIECAGRRVLLTHGDQLCTDDIEYQLFRQTVRNDVWRRGFLAKPLAERKALVLDLRRRSEIGKRGKRDDIMDVNAAAVQRLFADSGERLLIHGHTHRPAHHILEVNGRICERWVLPDWDANAPPARGGGLLLDKDGFRPVAP